MEERTNAIEELEKACSFESGKKEAYGQIRVIESKWDGESQIEVKAEISLINSDMLEIELRYAADYPLLYFYEFSGEAKINEVKYSICDICDIFGIRDNIRDARYYDKKIFGIRDDNLYGMAKVTIYSEEEFERNRQNESGKVYFEGEALFATSLAIGKKAVIVIEGKVPENELCKLRKLYDTYNDGIEKGIVPNNEIVNKLNDLFDENISGAQIDIYNVAQANLINCILNNKKNILFDVGITRFKYDRESAAVKASLSEISELPINGVILSHWDLDHILGIIYTDDSARNCTWIAPDFKNLYTADRYPHSVLRLCNFLIRNGKGDLCLIDTRQENKKYYESEDEKISIWLGTPKSSKGINKANNGGLLLKVKNIKSILLTGDCENAIYPEELCSNNFDYIVIPHHGSLMSEPKIKGKEDSIAYVSYGEKRGNCSLDFELSERYKRNNFENIRTTIELNESNVKYNVTL